MTQKKPQRSKDKEDIKEYFPKYCQWTDCEIIMRTGTSICKEYGYDFFAQETRIANCSILTSQLLCCSIGKLRPECTWSSCYPQTFFTPESVCGSESGHKFEAKRKLICSYERDKTEDSFRYECCPANITDKN
ncbi:hypothetical protein Bhyg_09032 [Pseudolycoriella hygida]|uniref:Uncharacterized protein n=1 Tax=Pseudolycoriella hygida TaxID=35572 RepID=A0A9Q0N6Q5_9DIPT|nr:hypothetical protein Bhyg_09032 [Pseudolycoriella hygida]